jgi:hypothetical protein
MNKYKIILTAAVIAISTSSSAYFWHHMDHNMAPHPIHEVQHHLHDGHHYAVMHETKVAKPGWGKISHNLHLNEMNEVKARKRVGGCTPGSLGPAYEFAACNPNHKHK